VRIQADGNARPLITFSFRGEDLSRLADRYHRGEVLANLVQVRDKINLLRDILFKNKESRHAATHS
jgi:hypothetical protein